MTQSKYAAQAKWEKEKSAKIVAKYKKEFVEEFKAACKFLNVTQSSLIRKMMEETIEQANEKRKITKE